MPECPLRSCFDWSLPSHLHAEFVLKFPYKPSIQLHLTLLCIALAKFQSHRTSLLHQTLMNSVQQIRIRRILHRLLLHRGIHRNTLRFVFLQCAPTQFSNHCCLQNQPATRFAYANAKQGQTAGLP